MLIIQTDFPIGEIDSRSTTSETISQSSLGMCVALRDSSPATPIGVSLDSSVSDYFICFVLNESTQTVTLTPSSGDINDGSGAASSKTLAAGASCELFKTSSGSPVVAHWKMLKGAGSGGSAPSGTGIVEVSSGAFVSPAALTKDTDGTLAANSDSRVATQKATNTAIKAAAPTTTEGDLIVRGPSANQRLPIGSSSQVLSVDTSVSGKVKWVNQGTLSVGMPNFDADVGNAVLARAAAPYKLVIGGIYKNTLTSPLLISITGSHAASQVESGYCDTSLPPTTLRSQALVSFNGSGVATSRIFVPVNSYYRFTGISDLNVCGRFYQLPDLTDSGDIHTTPGRALGTVYQNTSGKLMFVEVVITGVSNGNEAAGISDSAASPTAKKCAVNAGVGARTVLLVVLNGDYYKVTCASGSISAWYEYTSTIPATISSQLGGVSRSVNSTIYQNTGTKDRLVIISWQSGSSGSGSLLSDFNTPPTTAIEQYSHSAGLAITVMGIVYPNAYYLAKQDSDANPTTNLFWYEIDLG